MHKWLGRKASELLENQSMWDHGGNGFFYNRPP